MSQRGASGRFGRYFTLDDALTILPEIRGRLLQISRKRAELRGLAAELETTVRGNGQSQDAQPQFLKLVRELEGLVHEVQERGVIVRDLDTGLIDFPSIREGEEIFLCYRLGEETIEFWHGLEEGFPGRKPL
ncbi:MAG: DUF2203 domain-containing protein [Chloroflexi bacterium]|nr:DUF2203 domain-containing protein [Chloroflexota bacterium]MCY3939444.1 DUF2203 domain-containing protein [Chloroflexota bacterium]